MLAGVMRNPARQDPLVAVGHTPAYRRGDVVENFTLVDQHGEDVDLYSFCGQHVMIVFSAGWCGPCQQPRQAQSLQDEYGADGSQIIEVLIEDSAGMRPIDKIYGIGNRWGVWRRYRCWEMEATRCGPIMRLIGVFRVPPISVQMIHLVHGPIRNRSRILALMMTTFRRTLATILWAAPPAHAGAMAGGNHSACPGRFGRDVTLVPVGEVVGDGLTPVTLHLLALNSQGQPLLSLNFVSRRLGDDWGYPRIWEGCL